MTMAHDKTTSSLATFPTGAVCVTQSAHTLLRFCDLSRQDIVVIHTGSQANRDVHLRALLQHATNVAILQSNPLDPEPEPTNTLYVPTTHLCNDDPLYPLADSDATRRVIVHIIGQLHPAKAKRLIRDLLRQAPQADIYLGHPASNATPWALVAVVQAEQRHHVDIAEPTTLPDNFILRDGQLYYREWKQRGSSPSIDEVLVSAEVRVLAHTCDTAGLNHGRLLEWHDRRGHCHQWVMPMRALVARYGEEVLAALLDAGLPHINFEQRRRLIAYLMRCNPTAHRLCVERLRYWQQCDIWR